MQVGEFVLVALGFALPAWQHLLVACAAINGAALLVYPLVTESPRWLLSQGRTKEASAILRRIAHANQAGLAGLSGLTGLMPWPRAAGQPGQGPDSSAVIATSDTGSVQLEGCIEAGIAPQGPATAAVDVSVQDGAVLGLWQLLQQRAFAVRLLVLLINWGGLMLNYYGISMGAGGISGSL